jgi:hypothetical protein
VSAGPATARAKRPWVRRPHLEHVDRFGTKGAKWLREAQHVSAVLGHCSDPELQRLGALIDAWFLHHGFSKRTEDVEGLLLEVGRYLRDHERWRQGWARRTRAAKIRRAGNVLDVTRLLPRKRA